MWRLLSLIFHKQFDSAFAGSRGHCVTTLDMIFCCTEVEGQKVLGNISNASWIVIFIRPFWLGAAVETAQGGCNFPIKGEIQINV